MLIWFSILVLCHLSSYSMALPRDVAGDKLTALRAKMKENNLQAYIIPSEDEHQSEYIADCDARRKWISGFTGSAGVAVVTNESAALWTDSRYFLRAEKELDPKYWTLMKQGLAGVPSIDAWLQSQLKSGDNVGQNGKLVSISGWLSRKSTLEKSGINLMNVNPDIIDSVWANRPERPRDTVFIHDIKYSGETWQKKVNRTIDLMKDYGADIFVVTALDEVAWLFNIRSADIPYNPMVFAYGIVSVTDKPRIYIEESRASAELKAHLNNVEFRPYTSITDDIMMFVNQNKKIWVSPSSSYAIYGAVTKPELLLNGKSSPVRGLKGVKNSVEIVEARKCQIRDSAARIRHMFWLENMVKNNETVTEVSSAEKLEEIQGEDPLFRSLSFDSISAVGPHAADIHFSTNINEDQKINRTSIYLLDAGAQYEDCTTDITRTHHYGTPTAKEILAYTKVLQGSIDLANLVFPLDLTGRLIDVVARAPLWQAGLDYGHGTGHGIGYYLSVHENPPYGGATEFYVPGMFQSDEPGYYEDGFFGIRLETDLEVVEAKTPFNFRNITYLKFEPHSLVPFDRNLIDLSLLTKAQINWLDEYSKKIREKVGPLLQNNAEVYQYMLKLTEPIKVEPTTTTTTTTTTSTPTPATGTTTTTSTESTSTRSNSAVSIISFPISLILLILPIILN